MILQTVIHKTWQKRYIALYSARFCSLNQKYVRLYMYIYTRPTDPVTLIFFQIFLHSQLSRALNIIISKFQASRPSETCARRQKTAKNSPFLAVFWRFYGFLRFWPCNICFWPRHAIFVVFLTLFYVWFNHKNIALKIELLPVTAPTTGLIQGNFVAGATSARVVGNTGCRYF